MKKAIALILALTLCLSLCACGQKKINDIVLSKDSCELVIGDTYKLSYTVYPSDANVEDIVLSSSDTAIATVSPYGEITGVSPGETTITIANDEKVFAKMTVIVKQKPAYERLSKEEKEFVDCFLKRINNFKNPNSVYVEFVSYVEADTPADSFWTVKVRAENSFGGKGSTVYWLDKNGFLFETDDIWAEIGFNDYNLDLINEAIAEKR